MQNQINHKKEKNVNLAQLGAKLDILTMWKYIN